MNELGGRPEEVKGCSECKIHAGFDEVLQSEYLLSENLFQLEKTLLRKMELLMGFEDVQDKKGGEDNKRSFFLGEISDLQQDNLLKAEKINYLLSLL